MKMLQAYKMMMKEKCPSVLDWKIKNSTLYFAVKNENRIKWYNYKRLKEFL